MVLRELVLEMVFPIVPVISWMSNSIELILVKAIASITRTAGGGEAEEDLLSRVERQRPRPCTWVKIGASVEEEGIQVAYVVLSEGDFRQLQRFDFAFGGHRWRCGWGKLRESGWFWYL